MSDVTSITKIEYIGRAAPKSVLVTVNGKISSVGKCRNVTITTYYKNQLKHSTTMRTSYVPKYIPLILFNVPFEGDTIDLADIQAVMRSSNSTLISFVPSISLSCE